MSILEIKNITKIYDSKKNISTSRQTQAIKEYENLFELTPNLGNVISSYSHGMKQ